MKLDHERQLNKLIQTIKQNQEYVNTFTSEIKIDNKEKKEKNKITSLIDNKNEFV